VLLAIERHYLTSDDVHEAVAKAIGREPSNPNEWGALMNEAQAEGLIVQTGRYVKSQRGPAKKRTIKLFESSYHKSDPPDPDPVAEYELGTVSQTRLV
jgi:hypothetical protein